MEATSAVLIPDSLILIPKESAAPPEAAPPKLEKSSLPIGTGACAGDGGVGEGAEKPPLVPEFQPTPPRNKREKVITPGFDEFWAIYPRKKAKDDARKRWLTLKPSEELRAKIMAAVSEQSKFWTDPNYIPHPATWLNGKRWEDEIINRNAPPLVDLAAERKRLALLPKGGEGV
mgnify:FL=1